MNKPNNKNTDKKDVTYSNETVQNTPSSLANHEERIRRLEESLINKIDTIDRIPDILKNHENRIKELEANINN